MSSMQKTLAIVDDHPIIIDGLKSLLANTYSQFHIVSFLNGQTLLDYLEKNSGDIILLDIGLPDISGLDLCKKIKNHHHETIIIGLTNQAEQSTITEMLQNGASGFILKNAPSEEIISGIEAAMEGSIFMSKEVRKIFATPANSSKLPSITKREGQLLKLLAEGKTTAMIAHELHLSPFTVDTYRKNLLQKFEVKNTTELLAFLYKHNRM